MTTLELDSKTSFKLNKKLSVNELKTLEFCRKAVTRFDKTKNIFNAACYAGIIMDEFVSDKSLDLNDIIKQLSQMPFLKQREDGLWEILDQKDWK